MITLFAVLVIGGYAVYVMTPEERKRSLQRLESRYWLVRDATDKIRSQDEPFRKTLQARTAWPIVVPAILSVNVLVFVAMLLGSGSFSDADTLVGWGASFGPRTTNGEWWRVATALVVHTGLLQVIIYSVCLVQAGITLERLLGHAAVATVYVAAGLFANLQSLSTYPMGITAGASGAIFGVYGLLLATLLWSALQRAPIEPVLFGDLRGADTVDGEAAPEAVEPVRIPLQTLTRMAPVAGLFLLYTLAAGGFGTAALAGLLTGFVCGLVFARRATEQKTPMVQIAAAVAVTAVIIIASAAILRGVADVRPEIARLVALEDRTAGAYEKAVNQFRNGALSAQALAKLINQTIMPELQTAQARLKAIQGVPPEHQALVASAEEYFRLRDESWRLRADALFKSNLVALRAADRSERASLEALERIRPAAEK